jgi:Methyltransferase FkbM domain
MGKLQLTLSLIFVSAYLIYVALLYRHLQQSQQIAAELSLLFGESGRVTDKSLRSVTADWKPVYIYRGGPVHRLKQRWNGQVEQDKLISLLTKNKTNGYFVDLAANDPEYLSNTISLERHFNWDGLCIEANPSYWNELGRLRSCTVVGAVIGKHANEIVEFSLSGPGGGIVGANFDNKILKTTSQSVERYTTPLEIIFEQFHVPKVIDYFSLDVEGAENYIMDGFPFERYRFRFLTVERPGPSLTQKLADHGYRHVKKLVFFGDTLFAHESELPIDEEIIERYCFESGGRYCNETKSLIGVSFSEFLKPRKLSEN